MEEKKSYNKRERMRTYEKKKFTTIKIPEALKSVIYRILEETGEPLFWFENNSIKDFILAQEEIEKNGKSEKEVKSTSYEQVCCRCI